MNIDGITLKSIISIEQAISIIFVCNLKEKEKRKILFSRYFEDDEVDTDFEYSGDVNGISIRVIYKNIEGFSLILTGSLHKFFHGRNDNDFYEIDFETARKHLIDSFNLSGSYISPNGTVIKQIQPVVFEVEKMEVGINFSFPIDNINRFLNDNLLIHNRKKFSSEDGKTFFCRHEHYRLKIYEKGLNLLRFEIVLLKRSLRKYKITSLNHIRQENLTPIFAQMKKEAKDIYFADGIDFFTNTNYKGEKIPHKQMLILKDYALEKWHTDAANYRKSLGDKKKKKNVSQKLYRRKKKVQQIMADNAMGAKGIFVQNLNEKIDSFLKENQNRNLPLLA